MSMTDSPRSDSPTPAEEAKVREEWRRLERERIDEEVEEAREDAGAAAPASGGPHPLVWLLLAAALVAGLVVTGMLEGLFFWTRP